MLWADNIIETIGQWFDPTKPPDQPQPENGEIVVNGVVLPKLVADQIQKLGVSISWYNSYELEAAVRSCAVDCNLIDDPDGVNFMDGLEKDLDDDEKKDEKEFDPYRLNRLYTVGASVLCEPDEQRDASFRERIKNERERDRKRRSSAQKDAPEEMRVASM